MEKVTKRIVIIFIIVCILLYFVEISCLAGEHVNFADWWNILTDYGKQVFLHGLGHGLGKGFLDAVNQFGLNLPEGEVSTVINEYFEYINFISGVDTSKRDAVIKVINDLYKDPANIFIPVAEVSFIAYKKLKGENIELLLQKAREEALQN